MEHLVSNNKVKDVPVLSRRPNRALPRILRKGTSDLPLTAYLRAPILPPLTPTASPCPPADDTLDNVYIDLSSANSTNNGAVSGDVGCKKINNGIKQRENNDGVRPTVESTSAAERLTSSPGLPGLPNNDEASSTEGRGDGSIDKDPPPLRSPPDAGTGVDNHSSDVHDSLHSTHGGARIETLLRMTLEGTCPLDVLPPLNKKVFRIFFSSTFSGEVID